MRGWVGFAAGCVAGGVARVAVTAALTRLTGPAFPWGTLTVNLSGCLFIGVLNSLAGARWGLGPELRLMAIAGFCGAYTTFSALLLETSNLAAGGDWPRALGYYLGSGVAGFMLFRLGSMLGLTLSAG